MGPGHGSPRAGGRLCSFSPSSARPGAHGSGGQSRPVPAQLPPSPAAAVWLFLRAFRRQSDALGCAAFGAMTDFTGRRKMQKYFSFLYIKRAPALSAEPEPADLLRHGRSEQAVVPATTGCLYTLSVPHSHPGREMAQPCLMGHGGSRTPPMAGARRLGRGSRTGRVPPFPAGPTPLPEPPHGMRAAQT